MAREFLATKAVRKRVPILLGIMGPSGGGKTYSALRVAEGVRRVTGGKIKFIDSEADRALHYADKFDFEHIKMQAPFSSADYLEALRFADSLGPGPTIVDSFSHEHEGEGGFLEYHEAELDRMCGDDDSKRDRNNFRAWARPKAERQRLINGILQLGGNFIFCFRAKEKTKPDGKELRKLGWMPIAGPEFLFEMTINFLLPPGADGVPRWQDLTPEQELFMKAPPEWARPLLRDNKQLDEAHGEFIAKWAAGDALPVVEKPTLDELGSLKRLLVDGGLGTDETRGAWMTKEIGRPVKSLKELTKAEWQHCMDVAKEI